MVKRFLVVLVVAFSAFVAAPAASQAYIHQANAESRCYADTQPSASYLFTLWGRGGSTVASFYGTDPSLPAPNRVSDNRILVSVRYTAFGSNPPTVSYRCDVRGTSDADAYSYSITQSIP